MGVPVKDYPLKPCPYCQKPPGPAMSSGEAFEQLRGILK